MNACGGAAFASDGNRLRFIEDSIDSALKRT